MPKQLASLKKDFEKKFGLDCLRMSYLGSGDVFDGENYTKLLWSWIIKALKEQRKTMKEKIKGMEKSESPVDIAQAILKRPTKGFSGKNEYYPHPWVWNRVKGYNRALNDILKHL